MEVNKCDSPAWCHQRGASYETKWAMTRRKVANIYSETTLRKDACPISPSIYKISPLVDTLSGNQGVEIWEVWPYTHTPKKTQAPQHISSHQNIPTADQQKTFPPSVKSWDAHPPSERLNNNQHAVWKWHQQMVCNTGVLAPMRDTPSSSGSPPLEPPSPPLRPRTRRRHGTDKPSNDQTTVEMTVSKQTTAPMTVSKQTTTKMTVS